MEARSKPNQQRRLTKEPPTPLLDDNSSSRSLHTQSSQNLRRNPSAPSYNRDHQRTDSNYTSSNSSFERPSPALGSGELGSQTPSSGAQYYPGRRSLTDKSAEELSGRGADAAGTPQQFNSSKASGYQNALRRPGPPPLTHTNTSTDPHMVTPSLRQSASFSAGDRTIDSPPSRSESSFTSSSKRFSDESTTSKAPGRWRKKSGISGFMNSVLGSPRVLKISNPENPVHVTHVGYDNETGQFTVSLESAFAFLCGSLSVARRET